MSRVREAGAEPTGRSKPEWPSGPVLPLALLAVAVVAALLASQGMQPAGWSVLALVLACAGAGIAGAYWSRQRQLEKLREARLHAHHLGQMLDAWLWQTDAEHRLTRFQPPQAAPASAWVDGAASGATLWDRFGDADGSLRLRMQARAQLPRQSVQQRSANATSNPGRTARRWQLQGIPRFDARGRFNGYVGLAVPADDAQAQAARQAALQTLTTQGPSAAALVGQTETGWQLLQCSPAMAELLGLAAPPAEPLAWAAALAGASSGLQRALAAAPPGAGAAAGASAPSDEDGAPPPWRWLPIDQPEPADSALGLLLVGAPPPGADGALAALATEYQAFTYTLSHDLRAPIRVVEGFGRILKEDYGERLDRIGNDHLDRVVSAAARMNQMIDAMMSLSQLSTQPLARQSVNLSQLAGYVVDELRRQSPARQIEVHLQQDLLAQGDPTLLRMALENLLGNAWKYSARTPQASMRFERLEQAGRPVYCISDNGAGFDMRFADRLFGVFQRLHSASDFEGTGVGLASVRRIVRRHGGEIWAESEVGQGARFYFTLKA